MIVKFKHLSFYHEHYYSNLWDPIKNYLVFLLLIVFYHSLYQKTKIFYRVIVVMLRKWITISKSQSAQLCFGHRAHSTLAAASLELLRCGHGTVFLDSSATESRVVKEGLRGGAELGGLDGEGRVTWVNLWPELVIISSLKLYLLSLGSLG